MDVNSVVNASNAVPTTRTVVVKMTADINSYLQQMGVATNATNKFVSSLVGIDQGITRLKNSVGKALITIGGLGQVHLTASIVEAARYEQSFANLAKTVNTQTINSLGQLDSAVRSLSRSFPTSAGDVANLAANVASLGIQGTNNIKTFTAAAIKLGATTDMAGDQAVGSITRLMQTFGVVPDKIENVSGVIVKLANESNTSASGILSFATALQGVALQAGITLPQLTGLSAAVTSSGADAFAAATVMSRIIASMSRSVQIGSPELAQYAKTLGMTSDQFKKSFSRDAASTITQFIATVGQAGSKGIPILRSLGLDDARSLKVMENIAHASGDINAKIKESQDLTQSGGASYLNQAANKQFDTLFSQLKKFKNNIEDIFILMGRPFLKPLEQALKGVNAVFGTVNAGIDKILEYWHKLNEEISKVPVLKQAFGVFKEFVVILVALVPALVMATGVAILFASSILTMLVAIRAMRVVGPILEGFLKGLLGLRAGGVIFKGLDFLPFVNGIDQAGKRTQILAKMFAGLGGLLRGTVTLTYSLVKALFLGAGPIDRMGVAFSNLLVPIRRVLNLIPLISFDPSKLTKQSAQSGLISRGFAAAFATINTGWSAVSGKMTSTWTRFAASLRNTQLFSAAMTQAQAFGTVLLAQAARFKAAMATVSAPIANAIGGMLSTMGSGISGMTMRLRARSIPLGPSLQEASLAEGEAGAAGAGEAGLASAGLLSSSLMGLGLVVGGTVLAMKHFQGEADKMVDAFDKAGSAATDLATSLGKPQVQQNLAEINIQPGQPGYKPSTVQGVTVNDSSVLELAKHAQTEFEKVRVIEGQFAQAAMRSGGELTQDDLDAMVTTATKAGLSSVSLNLLSRDQQKGARFFEGGQFETSYVQALARSASIAQGRKSNPFTDVSGSSEANLRGIADAILTDLTQFGGTNPNFNRAVGSIIQTYNQLGRTNFGSDRGELFHSFLDQIRGEFGKTGDKSNLSFAGGGRRITDLQGVLDWAKSNANSGGTQGSLARAVLSQGSAFQQGNAAPFLAAASAQQGDIFRGFDAAAAAAKVGQNNQYYHLISGTEFQAQTGDVQGRTLGSITGGFSVTNLAAQKKAYQELYSARQRFIGQQSLTTPDAIAQNQVVQSLDSQLNKISGTIDSLSDKHLDRILGLQSSGQQISTVNAYLETAKKKVEDLRNEGGDIQLIDNALARVTSLTDKLTQVKTQGRDDLKSLIDLQRQQNRLDDDHIYNLQQAAKQENRSMVELQYQFNQNLRSAKDQIAQFMAPLDRIQATSTGSADDILFNLVEQGSALSKYRHQLDQLNNMGVSKSVIKGLGLDDPKNYQQVDRLFNDLLVNPKLIEKINKQWANRIDVSKAISTDKVRSQFNAMTREFEHSQKQIVLSYDQTVAAENRSYQRQAADLTRNILDITDKTRNALQTLLAKGLNSSDKAISDYAQGIKDSLQTLDDAVTKGPLDNVFKHLEKFFNGVVGFFSFGGKAPVSLTTAPQPKGGNPHGNPTLTTPFHALGGIVTKPELAHIAESGPEAILPLNARGADFMASVLQRHSMNNYSRYRTSTSSTHYNSYDYRTQYTGDISVQADDPRKMEQELLRRKRIQALRQPNQGVR